MNVAGLILAGGQSRRMGTDKSFVALNGVPLIQQVIDRARPQVSVLAVNTNSDDPRYEALGLPLVHDLHTGFQGPLAGLHAGLTWLQSQDAEWLATFACDTPFVPPDLVQKLWDCVHASSGRAAIARSGGKTHPVIGLWHQDILADADSWLRADTHKMMAFADHVSVALVDFSGAVEDPFININSLSDSFGLKQP